MDPLMMLDNKSKRVNREGKKILAQRVRKADKKLLAFDSMSEIGDILSRLKPGFQGNDVDKFRFEYLEKNIFSKFLSDDVAPAKVRWDNAVVSLQKTEEVCRDLNENGLRTTTPHFYRDAVFTRARSIIIGLIGLTPDMAMFESASFGSGASTHRTRAKGDPYFKYNTKNPIGVTYRCYKYAKALISCTPLWDRAGALDNLELCVGNDTFSVDKESTEDRLANKEPEGNAMLQRPIGKFIRSKLLKVGIDLKDQSRNQHLAYLGSVEGSLATLDIKSASHLVSQRLVFEFFPVDWVELLDDLRSPYGTLGFKGEEKTLITWQKHSTMGNGYTFELETLIFYALVKAAQEVSAKYFIGPVQRNTVCVYGDDIICPTYASNLAISILHDCGFTTNEKKSFVTGPFRESCGKHYYNGIDVTPFYVRSPINSVSRMIWFLNALKRWGAVEGVGDPRTQTDWLRLKREYVPNFLYGGRNSYSVSSLVSCEPQRAAISEITVKRRIDGIPAILRAFQYQSYSCELDQVNWFEQVEYVHRNPFNVSRDPWSQEGRDRAEKYRSGLITYAQCAEELDMTQIPNLLRKATFSVRKNEDIVFEPIFYPNELVFLAS